MVWILAERREGLHWEISFLIFIEEISNRTQSANSRKTIEEPRPFGIDKGGDYLGM